MSSDRYEVLGWWLVCHRKVIGTTAGDPICPDGHALLHPTISYLGIGTKFCPYCGTEVVHEQETTYASFSDVYDRSDFLDEEFCKRIEDDFYHVQYELAEEGTEILEPIFDGLFGIDNIEDEDEEGFVEVNPKDIKTDFVRQRKEIERRIKELNVLYDKIEIHFGSLVYWA